MWNKLTNALKNKHDGDDHSLYNHNNKSGLSSASLPFPSEGNPSPPPSPSKLSRRGVFKRLSKTPKLEGLDVGDWASPTPLKMPGFLPKTMPSLHLRSNDSQSSLPRGSEDQLYPPPLTPNALSGSVRSILRDANTPATGQNVRFFSRDAYKAASPADTSETDDMSFLDRLEKASPDTSPAQVVAPPRTSSSSVRRNTPPVELSGDVSNPFSTKPPASLASLFDFGEAELPPIPHTGDSPILDVFETATGDCEPEGVIESTPYVARTSKSPDSTRDGDLPKSPVFFNPGPEQSRTAGFDRSRSFSGINPGLKPVEKPLPAADQPDSGSTGGIFNRNRSMSDGAFRTLGRTDSASSAPSLNRDSGTASTASALPQTPRTPEQQHPDPFHVNATAFYTPVTPPTQRYISHSHKGSASSEDSALLSLRTQLAIQQELAVQYEVDLKARDELVDALAVRLDVSEKEIEKRRGALMRWRKKVTELEKIVRSLEDEVERSRDESFNRSVMDEASGQALRLLQGRIGALEKEKADEMRRALQVEDENHALKSRLQTLEVRDRTLRKELESVKDQVEMLHTGDDSVQSINVDDAKLMVIKREQALSEESERHRHEEFAWQEERAHLSTVVNSLETDKTSLQEQIRRLEDQQTVKDEEIAVLKSEVESQWGSNEKHSDDVQALESERNALRGELEKVDAELADQQNRMRAMEEEHRQILDEKEDFDSERDELMKDLQSEQHRTSELVTNLQTSERKLIQLTDEHQYTKENITRLQEQIHQRDSEISECRTQIRQREEEVEALREQTAHFKRDHGRVQEDQARELDEAARRERALTSQMEGMVREKAEADLEVGQVRERNLMLKEELERLRRQVQSLQQESASKEMQIVALTKHQQLAEEDKNNLNIALAAKQQELDLVKRNTGVKNTAAATPAPARAGIKPRDTNVLGTPSVNSRPPSRTSDSGRDSVLKGKLPETPRTAIKATASTTSALSKSTGVRASTTPLSSSTVSRPAMGLPAGKPRPSIGTATPSASRTTTGPLSRASSARPSVVSPPPSAAAHRRVTSAFDPKTKTRTGSITSALSEEDEKENARPASRTASAGRTPMTAL